MGSLAALSHKLEMSEVMYRATQGLAVLKLKLSGVSAVTRTDGGWKAIVELVERAAVPDSMDLLGVYEVHLDDTGEVVGYERIRIRRRCDLEEIAV
jgi:hypothetical protein